MISYHQALLHHSKMLCIGVFYSSYVTLQVQGELRNY